MKRKFKLFATVASLCLCLALMAFGVYAASSVTYTASGSVKYVVTDVFADFTINVYKASNSKGTKRATSTDVSTTTWDETAAVFTDTKYSYNNVSGDATNPGGIDPALKSEIDADGTSTGIQSLDFSVSDIYKIVIKVENKGKSGSINVKANLTGFGNDVNAHIKEEGTAYGTEKELVNTSATEGNKSVEYTYYVYLLDPAKTIEKVSEKDPSFSIVVTATNKA